MGRNLLILGWWKSSICAFHLGCRHSTFSEEGWALKKVRNAVNLSENVRNYLREVFLLGEETGDKANPGDGATHMKGLRDSSEEKRSQKKIVVDHCADFPLSQTYKPSIKVVDCLVIPLQHFSIQMTMMMKMNMKTMF